MVTADEIRQELYNTIDVIVNKRIKEAKLLDYYEGTVKKYNKKTNTYEVEANDSISTCYVKDGDVYKVEDTVIVLKFPTYRYIFSKKNAVII